MLIGVLEFGDYLVIAVLVMLISGGNAITRSFRRVSRESTQRLEAKIDLILAHLGIEYVVPNDRDWQRLALEPGMKIAAIKAYREETGASLVDAKAAIEEHMRRAGKN